MSHSNTALNKLAALFPRHEFKSMSKPSTKVNKFYLLIRWSQHITMTIAYLSVELPL